jgi:hypothetical protein
MHIKNVITSSARVGKWVFLKLGRKSKYIHLYIFLAYFLVKENSLFAQMVLVQREQAREFVF